MSETFGKPFWLEEARREMRSAGIGDEASVSEAIEQSVETSIDEDLLIEEEIESFVYEPTIETNTKTPCAPTQDLKMQEYLDNEVLRMRRKPPVKNHIERHKTEGENHEKTKCDGKIKEVIEHKSSGFETSINYTEFVKRLNTKLPEIEQPKLLPHRHGKRHYRQAKPCKKHSSQKKTDRKDVHPKMVPLSSQENNNVEKSLKYLTKKVVLPDVNIPLKDKLPKRVPLCYRTGRDSMVAGNLSHVNRPYFNSRDLIYQNCFSYNLISDAIEATRRGRGKAHPVTKNEFVNQNPIAVKPLEPELQDDCKPDGPLLVRPFETAVSNENDLEGEEPSSSKHEHDDDSPAQDKLSQDVFMTNDDKAIADANGETIIDVDDESQSSTSDIDVNCLGSSLASNNKTNKTTNDRPGAARQKSWAKTKLETHIPFFRRIYGDRTPSPVADSSVFVSVAGSSLVNSPLPVSVSETVIGQNASVGPNSGTLTPVDMDSGIVKRSPVVEKQSLHEQFMKPAPVQPGRKAYNLWFFKCFNTPNDE